MILSASRRTDIPAFYAEWFYERMREGYFLVRNPMNAHQVSRVDVTKENTDCIVFWSKNPAPMLPRLGEIDGFRYYFQYTLNGYGYDAEPRVPPLEDRLRTFETLSGRLGSGRVIWRYDPIFFSAKYSPEFHLECFEYIAKRLAGKTEKCVFSFVDIYPSKNVKNMRALQMTELSPERLAGFVSSLAQTAKRYGLTIATCAEAADYSEFGVEHNSCIDRALIEKLCGYPLKVKADGQRKNCGCIKCEEMGSYDTCPHGCVYCYANFRRDTVAAKVRSYDPRSPILCDSLSPEDSVTVRPVRSLRAPEDRNKDEDETGGETFEQLTLF